MKERVPFITTCLIVAGLLAVATFVSVEPQTLAAELPTDPAHAAHVAAAASQAGGQTVDAQLAEMRAKMQQLEAIIQQQSGATSGAMPMGGKPGMGSGTKPMQGKMAGMSAMGAGNPPAGGAPEAMKPAGGMGGSKSPPGAEMRMMEMKMDKMMGMMDKMTGGMGGGAMPAGAPMGGAAPGGGMGGGKMGMGKMEMGGGAMPTGAPMAGAAPGGGMGGGKMDMDKMEMGGMAGGSSSGGGMGMMDMNKRKMAGMMGMMSGMGGKGGSSMAMPSALPGFPGASHLYHIGATGFFLDHPQHIVLTTDQQAALNQAKEQAVLAMSTADRAIEQAEQDLWTLTGADQPDAAQIETKLAEIGKLYFDKRLSFIRAVGDASKLLTDEQRQILTGMASPAQSATGTSGPHKH